MHSTALLRGLREHLPQRRLSAQRPVANHQQQFDPHPTLVQVDQHLVPTLLDLPVAIGNGNQFLGPLGHGAHHDEDALGQARACLEENVHIDAVGPGVNVLIAGQVAEAPLVALGRPLLLEADHGVGAQPSGLLANRDLSASPKSPADLPFRCSQGISSIMHWLCRK